MCKINAYYTNRSNEHNSFSIRCNKRQHATHFSLDCIHFLRNPAPDANLVLPPNNRGGRPKKQKRKQMQVCYCEYAQCLTRNYRVFDFVRSKSCVQKYRHQATHASRFRDALMYGKSFDSITQKGLGIQKQQVVGR